MNSMPETTLLLHEYIYKSLQAQQGSFKPNSIQKDIISAIKGTRIDRKPLKQVQG